MDATFIQDLQQFAANHTLMVVTWVILFGAVLFNFYKGATDKFKVIENNEATLLINKEEGVVLDLRSDDEFKEGHIIDSVHLVPNDVKTGNIHSIDKYKEKPVILADTNGMTATSTASLLTKQGFTKVFVLKEGITGWKAASLPLVKRKHHKK